MLEHERSMVSLGDPPRDRQSESRALAAAGRVELDEPVEDPEPIAFPKLSDIPPVDARDKDTPGL